MPARTHIVVIGGGVIGLALAWRLRQGGAAVTVIERGEPGRAASWAAAGLLQAAPGVADDHPALLALTHPALDGYPEFVRELEHVSGLPLGFGTRGALLVSMREEEDALLDRREAAHRALGLPTRRLSPEQARWKERAVSPSARGALLLERDAWVNPRALTAALAEAFRRSGGRLCEREAARAVESAGGGAARGRVTGVRTDRRSIAADAVVLAAGAWSGRIAGVDPLAAGVAPVRGQALALDHAGRSFIQRPVRSGDIWAVPHNDGRIAVGATIEPDAGFDAEPRAGAIASLLEAVERLLPGIRELPFLEACAGLRPGSPDGLPILGASPTLDGLFYATGHHREGVLLAAETARLLAPLVARGEGAPALAPFSPARFHA
jgi:glycine oxidase